MSSDDSGITGVLKNILNRLTVIGLKLGGLVFIALTAYLLWGVYNSSLVSAGLKDKELAEAVARIQLLCRILLAGGVIAFVSAAYQYFEEEVTGYVLIILSALLRWGAPMLANASPEQVSLEPDSLPAHIIANLGLLGMIALIVAVPLILRDVWDRLSGTRRWLRTGAIEAAKRDLPKHGLTFFCWQTPHCRENLKGVCTAYLGKRSCWNIKAGCYCEEDRLLRSLTRPDPSPAAAFKSDFAVGLSGSQKRQRCRECFLYKQHQELKYKLTSPFMFLAAFGIMYYGFQTVKHYLHAALKLADEYSKHVSFASRTPQGMGADWTNASATSSAVEWVFIILIALILLTYMLRLLEYLLFDLQV